MPALQTKIIIYNKYINIIYKKAFRAWLILEKGFMLNFAEKCTKLINELIINIIILEWYKAQQKKQQEFEKNMNQITETTTTWITDAVE